MADNAGAPGSPAPAATELLSVDVSRPDGDALLAELQAAEEAAAAARPPAEGEPKPDETPAELAAELTEEQKVAKAKADEDAAAIAAKAAAEKPPEPETADVKKARSIFAAAGRKEAAALAIQKANKALESEVASLKATIAKGHEDPLTLLQSLGFGQGVEKDPIKDLLRKVVAQGEPNVQTAEERVAALEAKLAEKETKAQQESEAAAITNAQAQVTRIVQAEGDKFDLVNAFDAHDMVWETMVQYHATHGTPCTPQQAAEHVEKTIAAKLGKTTKFKAPAGAPAVKAADKPANASNGTKPTSDAPGRSETLTNTERDQPAIKAEDLPIDHDARFAAVAKEFGYRAIH